MLTSVILICNKERHLKRTLANLLETAAGEIEILVYFDGLRQRVIPDKRIRTIFHPQNRGRRVVINEAVIHARGDYIFHIDGHCRMLTDGWDLKMIQAAGLRSTAVASILNLRPDKRHLIRHVMHHPKHLANHFWDEKTPQNTVEDMMTLTGCAWMHHRNLWQNFNERYAGWGYMGIEWSLKNWLCGSGPNPILLCSDIVCEHIGRRHRGNPARTDWLKHNLSPGATLRHINKLYRNNKAPDQQRPLSWLIDKFKPVPGWHE
ncbi:Glycosyl transferase family 2 [Anaerohalosphaera lusitana]|uniref:Glycosyl transferase family 2 n=1 Tax=Anaerohalosphaera lusitana TaxID=1936003 RepID=A0A1U9NJN7_9BACT|nr:glycosyltransferase [Anaerohalosphaera lusitana]AQT67958.1 Glycosyl transferase family 2 [Anaerohalosphaera lusitana]